VSTFINKTRQLTAGHRDASREGSAEILRQRKAVLLSAAVHIPLRRRVATEEGGNATERRVRRRISTLRVHRNRKLRAGAATA